MVRQRVGLLVPLRGPAPLHRRETLLSRPAEESPAAADRPSGAATPPPRPTATERWRDLVALALVVGGVALFFYARQHLQTLAADRIVRIPGHNAVEQFVHYDRLARSGLWTAGGGLALAIASSLLRRRPASPPTQP